MGVFEIQDEAFFFRHFEPRPDVIFNNTIANGFLLKKLAGFKRPVASYVHELESVIEEFDKRGISSMTFDYSDLFIAPSRTVAANLINAHNIASEKIYYLNYFVDRPHAESPDRNAARATFMQKFKIPTDRFCVVGMGTATHRKGIDIFVEACRLVNMEDGNIHFFWIGDYEDEEMRVKTNEFLREQKLDNAFTMTGRIPHSFFNLLPFDLFVLTSREDPYPMVVIEAAMLQLPTVCFDRSGGAAEFVANDAGWTIPGFSAEFLAQKIIALKNNPSVIREKGENAGKKAMTLHGDPTFVRNQFELIIKNLEKSNS